MHAFCMFAYMCVSVLHAYVRACIHACMHVCIYLCMHACTYVCMFVCMYYERRVIGYTVCDTPPSRIGYTVCATPPRCISRGHAAGAFSGHYFVLGS